MKDRCAIPPQPSAEPRIERRSEAIANVAYGSTAAVEGRANLSQV